MIYLSPDATMVSFLVEQLQNYGPPLAAALGSWVVLHNTAKYKRWEERDARKSKDMLFLYELEAEYIKHEIQRTGKNPKVMMRERVRAKGFEWSGRNTPSRLRAGAKGKPSMLELLLWPLLHRKKS